MPQSGGLPIFKRWHYAWIVIGVTFLALLASGGTRASFGVFIKPIEAEFGWNRATVSLAASISALMYGAGQPLVGYLIDRWGPRWVLVLSVLGLGLGAGLTALTSGVVYLYVVYGMLTTLAASGPSVAMSSSVVARWFQTNRGLALGICTSGISAGQLIIIPLAMQLNVMFGWRWSFAILGGLMLALILPLVFLFMRNSPREVGLRPFGAGDLGEEGGLGGSPAGTVKPTPAAAVRHSLASALGNRDYWLIVFTQFVCGFTSLGAVATHLPAHTIEHGFSPMVVAGAMGLMGGMNFVGTILSGWLTDRAGRRQLLSSVYGIRGLAVVYLMFVHDAAALSLFAIVFGLTYIAATPPTASILVDHFGTGSVASLLSWAFVGHQIGAAIGAYTGGLLHDLTGGYTYSFIASAALAFIAAAASLMIRRSPVPHRVSLGVPA